MFSPQILQSCSPVKKTIYAQLHKVGEHALRSVYISGDNARAATELNFSSTAHLCFPPWIARDFWYHKISTGGEGGMLGYIRAIPSLSSSSSFAGIGQGQSPSAQCYD